VWGRCCSLKVLGWKTWGRSRVVGSPYCEGPKATIGEAAGSKTASLVVNTGTIETGEGSTSELATLIRVPLESSGTIDGTLRGVRLQASAMTLASASTLKGTIQVEESAVVTAGNVSGSEATVSLLSGATVSVLSGDTATIGTLKLEEGVVAGAGTLSIPGVLSWEQGTMSGSGRTVLATGASGTVLDGTSCRTVGLSERTLVNDGTLTLSTEHITGGQVVMSEGAHFENAGVFNDNSGASSCSPYQATFVEGAGSKTAPLIVNTGTFGVTESASPSATATVDVPFENRARSKAKPAALGSAGKCR